MKAALRANVIAAAEPNSAARAKEDEDRKARTTSSATASPVPRPATPQSPAMALVLPPLGLAASRKPARPPHTATAPIHSSRPGWDRDQTDRMISTNSSSVTSTGCTVDSRP